MEHKKRQTMGLRAKKVNLNKDKRERERGKNRGDISRLKTKYRRMNLQF